MNISGSLNYSDVSQNFQTTHSSLLYNERGLKIQIRHLKNEAQKMEQKFHELVHYANLKGVNITKQISDMNKILEDRPDTNQLHQNEAIHLLYETKMRREYCNQIESKLSENSSRQLLNPMVLEEQAKHLVEKTAHLTYVFEKWVSAASNANVKVHKQVEGMKQVLEQLPDRSENHQSPAVAMLYEMTVRTLYCNQIIRKCAKSLIHKTATEARGIPKLHKKIALINQCEQYLLKMLPQKMSKVHYSYAENQYEKIFEEINNMKRKLLG